MYRLAIFVWHIGIPVSHRSREGGSNSVFRPPKLAGFVGKPRGDGAKCMFLFGRNPEQADHRMGNAELSTISPLVKSFKPRPGGWKFI